MSALLDVFTTPRNLTAAHRWSTITGLRPEGVDAVAVRLARPRRWPGHRAGQFVLVSVQIDGVWHERCFSLTSPPDAPYLELVVQSRPGGTVSRHLVERARVGDRVRLDGPSGDFVLPPEPRRLLAVTAGSGMTPIVSMVRWLDAVPRRSPELDLVWIHHTRSMERLLLADELTRWSRQSAWVHLDLRVTGDGDERFDPTQLDARCADWAERTAYVCGPDDLRQAAVAAWSRAGVEHRLVTESFGAALDLGSGRNAVDSEGGAAAGPRVACAERSGRSFDADGGPTLLDSAELAGLTPRAGCRMGICHTCSTHLIAGSVRDLRDGRTHDAGDHVQLCVSAPLTDLSLDL